MVLEELIDEKYLKSKPWIAFLMGFAFSLTGIISAAFVFRSSPGYMTIGFTAVLLVPAIHKLIVMEESSKKSQAKDKESLSTLFKRRKSIIQIFFFLFIGIFTAYAFVTLAISPQATEQLFSPQLAVAGLTGQATEAAQTANFQSILRNNMLVLSVALILSLIYGAGSIIFLTWNAATWAVIFAYVAKQVGYAPFEFFRFFAPYIPHTLTEGVAYFLIATVGGLISQAVLREQIGSEHFNELIKDAGILAGITIIFIILAAAIEVMV